MGSIVRFGIVGWNEDAAALYEAISSADGAEVSLIVADETAQAAGLQEMVSARLATDAAEALRDDGLQALYISAPAGSREDLVLSALERGKHVLMPPPLALDASTGAQLLQAAAHAGSVLQLASLWQADAAMAAVRDLLRTGLAGSPTLWQSSQLQLAAGQDWRPALAEDLALFHYLTGLKASSVLALSRGTRPGARVVMVTVEYGDTAAAILVAGSGVVGAGEAERALLLVTGDGQFDLCHEPRVVLGISLEDAPAGTWRPVRYRGRRGDWEGVLSRFLRTVAGELPADPAQDPLEVPRMMGAIAQSLEQRGPVRISR